MGPGYETETDKMDGKINVSWAVATTGLNKQSVGPKKVVRCALKRKLRNIVLGP